MKRKWIIILILLVALCVIPGCSNKKESHSDPLKPITLNLTYIPNIQFAPMYAAIEKGYFEEAGLKVSLNYGNEVDLITLVGAGKEYFMIASGEQVLLSRSQGLPVVYVMAWYEDYPVGVVTLKEKDIAHPQDLKGKTIGIPGLYGASYIGFEALRRYAGLNEQDITLHSIGFSQVETITEKQADAAVIYVANEPNILESLGYEVNVMGVADYLRLVGNGLVTNEDTLKKDPELVRAVVGSLIKGIIFAKDYPDEVYEISKKYVENLVNADEKVQKAVLQDSIELWNTEQPGFCDESSWENMQKLLMEMGLLKQEIDLKKTYTNEFVK